jgi:hypothetical protein
MKLIAMDLADKYSGKLGDLRLLGTTAATMFSALA